MARIRCIKPEFWQDERLATVSRDARLLFIGLWNLADDDGRLRGSHLFIRAHVFPYDLDVNVEACLAELERLGRIVRYTCEGEHYVWVRNFNKHQKLDRRSKSLLPEPPDCPPVPAGKRAEPADCPPVPADCPPTEGNREQGTGKGTEQGSAQSADAAGEAPKGVMRVEPPTAPPEAWSAEDFWRWAQGRRQASGYPPERWPKPRQLSVWWSEARGLADTPKLKEAFYRFGDDDYWGKAKPAYPFQGFMSQWNRFLLSTEETHAA